MDIRKFLRANPLVSTLYYHLHFDDLQVLIGFPGYMRRVKSAIDKFNISASGGG